MGSKFSKLRKQIKLTKVIKKVLQLGNLILKLSDFKNLDLSVVLDKLNEDLKLINKNEEIMRNVKIPKPLYTELSKYIAKLYMDVGCVEIFSKFLNIIFSKVFENKDNSEIDSKEMNCFSILANILINSSEAVWEFGKVICEKDDLLKLFYKILEKSKEKAVDDGSSEAYRICVEKVVFILCNTLIHDSTHNIKKMKEYNFVKMMKDLSNNPTNLNDPSDKKTDSIRTRAILFESYVVDEDDVDTKAGYEKQIRHIISVTEDSLKDGNVGGLSTEELAKGIFQLSRIDKNKNLLVDCKILDLIQKLLDTKSMEIQKASLSILLSLTFDKEHKKAIKEKFLEKLENMRNDLDKCVDKDIDTVKLLSNFGNIIHINPESGNEIGELRQILDKVLWVLKNEEKPISQKVKNEGKPISKEVIKITPEDMIMISYNHAEKELVEKLYAELKGRNYKLWIDFEDMQDKMIESMALAVEQSKAIIICASSSYSRSIFCRQEMVYAIEQQKCLVPVLVEKDYKPNGWLGFGLAGLLRVNMSGKFTFEVSLSKMVDHLTNKVFKLKKLQDIDKSDKKNPASAVITEDKSPNNASGLASWTNSDVKEWLKKIGVTEINSETKWKGTDLEFLKEMDKKTFAKFCKESLTVCDLNDTTKIYDELQKL